MPSYEYLIGASINRFEQKLPRGIDIIRFYFHFENAGETEKISHTAREIQNIYQQAGISTVHFESIRSKTKRLVSSVKSIVATRKSRGSTQIRKVSEIFEKFRPISCLLIVIAKEEEYNCWILTKMNFLGVVWTPYYGVIEKVLAIGNRTAGGNSNDFAISKTALCSQLSSLRSSKKTDVLQQITSNDEKALLHFDGKKFAKINQKHIDKDSWMVAVCHTAKKDIPIGLPILSSGEAESYASHLFELCERYNMSDRIVGLVCDTTTTNTGIWGGVCVLFEEKIKKDVLNLMCRPHVLEVFYRQHSMHHLELSMHQQ